MMQVKKSLWRRRLLKSFAGLLLFLIAAGLMAFFFPQQVLTIDSGPLRADAMVVLGGTADRPVRAAELFREGEAPKILVSGYGDCVSNEKLLGREGVPRANIILEPKSRTTRENAEFSVLLLRQMGAQRVIIVTSWYHSRRALSCFEHYAPEIKFYSRPSYFGYVGKVEGAESRSQMAERKVEWKRVRSFADCEYMKLLGYWVCYGVCPI